MPSKFRFNEEDKRIISEYWFVGCTRGANQICDTHGVKHRRTPDLVTFTKLVELYPTAPLQAWGEVFNVTRESIRVLHMQISDNKSWKNTRQEAMFGSEPDKEKFNMFFDKFSSNIKDTKSEILDVCNISKSELSHWLRKDTKLNEQYENARAKRKHKKNFPTHITCYRCGIEKPVDEFGASKDFVNGKARTCKVCNRTQVKTYMLKRAEEFDPTQIDKGKVCPKCNTYKTRASYNIAKKNKGGLQAHCIRCQDKMQRANPVRKAKFVDAGFDKSDYDCVNCRKSQPVTEYYLIRFVENGRYKKIMTDTCRECVDDFYSTLGDKSITKPQFVQLYRNKSMYKKSLINLFDLVDELNSRYVNEDTIISGRYDGL